MLAENTDLYDVAICWPRDRMIGAVRRSGRCPSSCIPLHLRPGGRVALVDEEGSVRLVFRLARIEEHVLIRAADGKKYERGAVLVGRPGSVRSPGNRDPKKLSVNHHAPGALAYFDPITYRYVRIVRKPETVKEAAGGYNPPRLYPLFADNIGKTLSQPERCLIRAYTRWVGDDSMFGHHQALKKSGLYTDLFIPRCWTLFEAKASMGRRTLREAIGQLYDYQRHYDRSPRLAILLPQRPSSTLMELFEKRRIIVVWRSRGASFSDSAGGVVTGDLREIARSNFARNQV